jgi:deazaflavin-dependent oxidoreductase (nitroreductase family)
MNPVMKAMWRLGSRVMTSLYKMSGGRIGGHVKGLRVVLLTVRGRTSGEPRTTAVSWFDYGQGHVVVGSAGGLPQVPQWFKNLRKAPQAQVQVGREVFKVDVRELQGEERDTVWSEVVLAQAPFFAGYEDKGHRTMPIALLTPVSG